MELGWIKLNWVDVRQFFLHMHAYASMYWFPVFFKYSWMLLSWIKLNQAEWSWIWVQLRWSKCCSLGFWRLVSCETYVRESVKFGISTGPTKSTIFRTKAAKFEVIIFYPCPHRMRPENDGGTVWAFRKISWCHRCCSTFGRMENGKIRLRLSCRMCQHGFSSRKLWLAYFGIF